MYPILNMKQLIAYRIDDIQKLERSGSSDKRSKDSFGSETRLEGKLIASVSRHRPLCYGQIRSSPALSPPCRICRRRLLRSVVCFAYVMLVMFMRHFETLAATKMADHELTENMQKLLIVMQRLDQKIGPMLEADGEYFNKRWGYISRAGLWDKSHLTRQIEKYADIYTSRVSNFLHYTPFMYFCSQEQTIAHDTYSYTSNRIGNHDL